MRALLTRILRRGSAQALILLAVIGLIAIPPVLTGNSSLRQAESAWDSGDFSDAAVHYERSARFLPWRQDLWEQAAMAQSFSGNFDYAILSFEKVKQHDTLSAEGWDLLGQSYWLTDDREFAVAELGGGIRSLSAHAKIYYHLSMAYFDQGDVQAEQDALEKWVAAEGETDAPARYRLGLLLSISEPDRALGEFLLASSLDPEYDSAVETMRTALNLASLETDKSSGW